MNQRIESLLKQMTLEEKASLCSGLNYWYLKGIKRLGIPSIMMTDGPHGLRKQSGDADQVGLHESIPATCFPTASALAATWNRDLIFEVGKALGEEGRQEKVGVILGPGVNIKRSPLCGRNFEYFSEDPYLAGEMARSHINGVQSQGIGTSMKHYAVNNQEFRRATIDAIVDERALREIYLAGYEIAVKEAQPWTVMCAYNKVNGTYCCENKYLMDDILRQEWGFAGLVVTDWGAMNERVEALKAGVDLEMPGATNGNDARIVAAVKSGELDECVLDRALERILPIVFRVEETLSQDFAYDQQAHHALARRVAGEGAVLLKNEAQTLPLQPGTKIALIGQFAKKPRYQGVGSSIINPSQLDTLYDEMVLYAGQDNIVYAPGYSMASDAADEDLIQEAVQAANSADVVVICAGLTDKYETEGVDRKSMSLPLRHNALIQKMATVHDKVVVVLSNGSPVEMPWVNEVPAILEGYLGGQAGAGALADILFGRINPSGKLAESFPLRLEDNPSHPYFPGGPAITEYRESIFVGYRYYDSVAQEVLFPFGHGLSYTSFEYRDLQLKQAQGPDVVAITVKLRVRNTGRVAGKEIVQVYVQDVESSVFRPLKELKGFAKVELGPGEETDLVIELDRRAFAFYDPVQKDWVVEAGEFKILVGASSRDIRLAASVQVASTQKASPVPGREKLAAYYQPSRDVPITQAAFEALLGHPVPINEKSRKGQHSLNTPLCDMNDSFIGRLLFNMVNKQAGDMLKGQEDTPTTFMIKTIIRELPPRSMISASLPRQKVEALLMMVNGRFFKGLLAMIKPPQA